jgi:hypothetical protein
MKHRRTTNYCEVCQKGFPKRDKDDSRRNCGAESCRGVRLSDILGHEHEQQLQTANPI